MSFRANTTVSILRGGSTDDFGDVVDDPVTVRRRVPASIVEQSRRVFLPAEGAFRVVRTLAGRVPAGTDVLKSDRIKDERTSQIYLVEELSQPATAGAVMLQDIALQLSYTN